MCSTEHNQVYLSVVFMFIVNYYVYVFLIVCMCMCVCLLKGVNVLA